MKKKMQKEKKYDEFLSAMIDGKKVLTEEEIKILREGLLKKLEQLKFSYGQIAHKKKYDTLVLLRKKEGLEKEIAVVEKDLQLLNNRNVVVDLTK